MSLLRSSVVAFGLIGVIPMLAGCAATQVAISKRDLDVQTKMSATVFLDPVKENDRTVLVQFRNTSDKQTLDLYADLATAVANKGYRITTNPDEAHYLLQANVLYVGKVSPTAAEVALKGGYGGALSAGMGMAALAYAAGHRNDQGLVGAGFLGAVGNTIANAMVKDVYFSIVTDIQIKERAGNGTRVNIDARHTLAQGTSGASQSSFNETSDWKTYQTRVISTANKVNLEFDEAVPELRTGLVRSLAGIF
ncbi:MAG: TraT complement resistance protein precursor [Pseudomonadota bacterium]|nr:complement resistance protein TraT [Aestuariivirga sp.]